MKYQQELDQAVAAIHQQRLPARILTRHPTKKVISALRQALRTRGYFNGFATDPDGGAVYIKRIK